MTNKLIVESRAHIFLQLFNLRIEKLNYSAAPNADKVIVVRAVEPVLVAPFTITNIHPRNETILVKEVHGSTDRGAGDVYIPLPQRKIDLLRLTMFIGITHFPENLQTLRGNLEILRLEN